MKNYDNSVVWFDREESDTPSLTLDQIGPGIKGVERMQFLQMNR